MEQIASDISACPTPTGLQTSKETKTSKSHRISAEVGKRKLNTAQQMDVIKQIAEFVPAPQIVKNVKADYGILISTNLVNQYKDTQKWRPVIEKIRNKQMAKLSDVGGYHKYVRLMRAEGIHDRCVEKGDEKTALSSIEHQRKEVEGDVRSGDTYNLLQMQFSSMSDEEIQKRKEQLIDYLNRNKQVIQIKAEE